MSALDVQVGGDHYKKYKIQPMEYSMANGLDACQHTAIKYLTRFRDKGGIADLEKAKHCIDLLIEFENKAEDGAERVQKVIEDLVQVTPPPAPPSKHQPSCTEKCAASICPCNDRPTWATHAVSVDGRRVYVKAMEGHKGYFNTLNAQGQTVEIFTPSSYVQGSVRAL